MTILDYLVVSSALSFPMDQSCMNPYAHAHVHLPCISILMFINFFVLVGLLLKWWNRVILSFMQSLHDFVPAVFINDNAEPVEISSNSSNCRVLRHQEDTSSLEENSLSWIWAHKCLGRIGGIVGTSLGRGVGGFFLGFPWACQIPF